MSKTVNEKAFNTLIINVLATWNRLSKSRRMVEKPFNEFAEYAGLDLKTGYNEQMKDFIHGVIISQKHL